MIAHPKAEDRPRRVQHGAAQVRRQLVQVLVGQGQGEAVLARFGQDILDVVGRVVLELVQVEVVGLPRLAVRPGQRRLLQVGHDESSQQGAEALAQDPLRQVDQQHHLLVQHLTKAEGGLPAKHQADIRVEEEPAQLVQDRRDPLVDRPLTLGKLEAEVAADSFMGKTGQQGLTKVPLQKEAGQIEQREPQPGEGQEAVGQQPDQARGTHGVQSPDLHHHIGQEEGEALRGEPLHCQQRVQPHRPLGLARVHDDQPPGDLGIPAQTGGQVVGQVAEEVAVGVDDPHPPTRQHVLQHEGFDRLRLAHPGQANDVGVGGPGRCGKGVSALHGSRPDPIPPRPGPTPPAPGPAARSADIRYPGALPAPRPADRRR